MVIIEYSIETQSKFSAGLMTNADSCSLYAGASCDTDTYSQHIQEACYLTSEPNKSTSHPSSLERNKEKRLESISQHRVYRSPTLSCRGVTLDQRCQCFF
jgi:hypothetical protein